MFLLTFGLVTYVSTTGSYAVVTKGQRTTKHHLKLPADSWVSRQQNTIYNLILFFFVFLHTHTFTNVTTVTLTATTTTTTTTGDHVSTSCR